MAFILEIFSFWPEIEEIERPLVLLLLSILAVVSSFSSPPPTDNISITHELRFRFEETPPPPSHQLGPSHTTANVENAANSRNEKIE